MINALRPVLIIEPEYGGLGKCVRSAQRCGVLLVAFYFCRPALVAFDQGADRDAAHGDRCRKVEWLAELDLSRLLNVRYYRFFRQVQASANSRQGQGRAHQLQEPAPA